MPLINKNYDFLNENKTLYNIDSYTTHLGNAITFDSSGNAKLKNFNTAQKSKNFFGDGRLGSYRKNENSLVSIRSLYFTSAIKHDTYGPILYNIWYDSIAGQTPNDINPFDKGDELFIMKKHVVDLDHMDEYGQWDVVRIKEKIVDSDGVHLSIEELPENTYTENTANAAQLVLQYKNFEIYDGYEFSQHYNCNSSCQIPHWDNRSISYSSTVIFIKSMEYVKLGKNATLSNRYGHNGCYDYRYSNDTRYYLRPGAPLGAGRDNRSSTKWQTDLSDPTSAHYNLAGTPGGRNLYGKKYSESTTWSRALPEEEDLNNKIYCGNGAPSNLDPTYNYYRIGYSGGGIVIIQTPNIEMKSGSKIASYGGSLSSKDVKGAPGNGDILIKCETLQTHSVEVIEDTSAIENFTGDYSRFYNASIVNSIVSTPGTIQVELDNLLIDDTTYTYSDLQNDTSVFDNLVQSTVTQELHNSVDTDEDEQWNNDTRQYSLAHISPLYEANKIFKIYTSGLHNIDISKWYKLEDIETIGKQPEGCTINILFSFDSGSSWFKIDTDNKTLVVKKLSEINEGNTIEELSNFSDETFYTTKFIINNNNKTIDVAIGMSTDKQHITPSVDKVIFKYGESQVLQAPICISPFNGKEFNNENVIFVWLQPEQQYGSVQNRIEVSTNEFFTQDFIETVADDSNSSNNNKIHIPYKATEYDNQINDVQYFKAPYLKSRFIKPNTAGEENTASVLWNPDKKQITYNGKDLIFHKGRNITLPDAGVIQVPDINSEAPLIRDMDSIPKASNIKSHIVLSSIDTQDDISDIKGVFINKNVKSGVIFTGNNYLNKVNRFLPTGETDIIMSTDTLTTDNFLGSYKKDMTFHVKFNPKNLKNGDNSLFQVEFNNGVKLTGLTLYYDNNSGNIYPRLYNNHSFHPLGDNQVFKDSRSNKFRQMLKKNTESNITVTLDTGNVARCYINGLYAGYFGTAYNDDKSEYIVNDGENNNENYSSYNIRIGSYDEKDSKFDGLIHEIVIWDEKLDQNEILEISKLPIYDLRYNIENSTYSLLQFPYRDHIKYHPSLDNNYEWDEIDSATRNLDNKRGEITPQHMGGVDEAFYESNNYSLKIAQYSPIKNEETSFSRHKMFSIPVDGLSGTFGKENASSRVYNIVYKDNNSIKTINNTESSFIFSSKRIIAEETDIEVDFIYNGKPSANYDYIGLQAGARDAVNTDSYYSFYALLRFEANGNITFYHNYYDSNNTVRNPYNYVDLMSIIGVGLTEGNIYTLRFNANSGPSTADISISSNTDANFETPKIIDNYYDYGVGSYGYNSDDYNDITAQRGRQNTNAVMVLKNNSGAITPISLNTRNSNSNKTEYVGYLDSYVIENTLESSYTNKINTIDINADIYDANTFIKFAISFDNGNTWRKYDAENKAWSNLDIEKVNTDGMDPEDIMSISTRIFEAGGFDDSSNVKIRSYLFSSDSSVTPYLESIRININGPLIIDSWEEPGSFYDPTKTFKYLDDNSWNPYMEVDLDPDNGQNWEEMGSGIPDPMKFVENHGSKPTSGTTKAFGAVSLNLLPKGKYYWRVAAYNAS